MAKSSVWHCRKHKHVFDKTRFWDHLHLVTRIETAVGLDLVVNRPKVKRFGSWCSALGKIRPIIFPAPRKCYSVSVPNWGTSKKTTPILSEAQKRPRYWKNCLLPPSVFLDNGNMASWTGGVSASLKGSGTMESMESSFELSILDSTIDLDATAAYLAAKS